MIGKTEQVELSFTGADSGLTGVMHTPDGEIKLNKIRLQGRTLTFDAARQVHGHPDVCHYEGELSGDTIDFTVQNDDGSLYFRFTAHRQ